MTQLQLMLGLHLCVLPVCGVVCGVCVARALCVGRVFVRACLRVVLCVLCVLCVCVLCVCCVCVCSVCVLCVLCVLCVFVLLRVRACCVVLLSGVVVAVAVAVAVACACVVCSVCRLWWWLVVSCVWC